MITQEALDEIRKIVREELERIGMRPPIVHTEVATIKEFEPFEDPLGGR